LKDSPETVKQTKAADSSLQTRIEMQVLETQELQRTASPGANAQAPWKAEYSWPY